MKYTNVKPDSFCFLMSSVRHRRYDQELFFLFLLFLFYDPYGIYLYALYIIYLRVQRQAKQSLLEIDIFQVKISSRDGNACILKKPIDVIHED
jgi:hypothetical protein